MLKKPKICVVGSFMMDLIASTHRIPNEGETVVGFKFTTAPGGKGANQAVQCARLGADVTMVGRVGKDAFGDIMVGAVKAAGVDVSHVTYDETESSGVGHIELEVSEHDARNRIIVCPGANFKLTPDHISWLKDEIKHYDMVIMQLELSMDVIETVASWAHESGVPVMLNPAPAAILSDELLSHVTYLSPNEHEAAMLSGHKIDVSDGINMDDVNEVAEWFSNRGVDKLIITMGENGSFVADANGISHTDVVKMTDVKDTTAAGDSFVGGFCTGKMAGLSERDALAFASHVAAITVTRMGAIPSLPDMEEVIKLLKERNTVQFNIDELSVLL